MTVSAKTDDKRSKALPVSYSGAKVAETMKSFRLQKR